MKVLIANRGEIALRIIRACRELNLECVAVYSDADVHAPYVSMANQSVRLGPAPVSESYLNTARILDAAAASGANAVHPGFGFLSENADFARAVVEAGLTFIGPSPEVIAQMGSKTEARALMARAGVPCVPGYQGSDLSPSRLLAEAEKIGYPVLVKAAAGGGGKGMRIVSAPDQMAAAADSARRESARAFGNDLIFLEKYLTHPRHIEIQVFGDHHGNVVHLFERECSIQRRHQKVVEESPSPALSPALRHQMGSVAVAAARSVGYANAGTVEMILDTSGAFYFLEMNTRLQVEHPVTECVTGIDLVQLQLRVAAGEALPFRQEDLSQRGHAIEVRVYAEDPAQGFLPAIGTVLGLREPHGPGIRVDSSLFTGMEVSIHYDPMLAKLITHSATREANIARMDRALESYAIHGVTTNLSFLRDIIRHPAFARGDTTTSFIEQFLPGWQAPLTSPTPEEWVALAVAETRAREAPAAPRAPTAGDQSDVFSPWHTLGSWRGTS